MRLHIGICDDEKVEIDYLRTLVSKWADKSGFVVQLSTFPSAENFLFEYAENKNFDILLLDIQMDKMDGVELAKQIRKENESVQIVFITGFPDFLAEGYEVSALHYLMKPVKEEKLSQVLDKAVSKLQKNEKSLFLNIDGENLRIPLNEILFIEAQGHYILINTQTNKYKIKMNLSDIEKSLDNGFFRSQRSFIVGLKYIKRITRTAVFLENNLEIPLSRGLYDNINQAVINYFQ